MIVCLYEAGLSGEVQDDRTVRHECGFLSK
jgi:hypothetical protein